MRRSRVASVSTVIALGAISPTAVGGLLQHGQEPAQARARQDPAGRAQGI